MEPEPYPGYDLVISSTDFQIVQAILFCLMTGDDYVTHLYEEVAFRAWVN